MSEKRAVWQTHQKQFHIHNIAGATHGKHPNEGTKTPAKTVANDAANTAATAAARATANAAVKAFCKRYCS